MAKAGGFGKWIDTFLMEKGIDAEEILEVDGASGANFIPVGSLIDVMRSAPAHEQKSIRATLVRIDFRNGDVRHFLHHLAKAIAA